MAPRSSRRGLSTLLLAGVAGYCALSAFAPSRSLALVAVAEDAAEEAAGPNFFTKVFAAAAQGMTAAIVAALLSAVCEPLVNRLLVKRMTVAEAYNEITFKLVSNFFLTTFPTNMLKFPVFEMINMALSFTSLAGSVRGVINGFLFCTIMLPVTNYRFRVSMGWEIKPALLYQAYIPTVARDIIYGWARGVVGGMLASAMAPDTMLAKAFCFGLTIWAACIISSPCNEWRGYSLQPADRKLTFGEYFKPVNYARSTGIGATIMGIALMVGMLVTPYAEIAFAFLKANKVYTAVGLILLIAMGSRKK
eukprot:TRINITY_DN1847_c0_g1_i6.p2 TRINITY_DN1847_c0_g1~~TRINITY_DN1847_c0_g1_i6.p2  ORF type:complete len:326 (+),score=78.80 TRINITY_DN1847_c0_g1_i6:62-979(+)